MPIRDQVRSHSRWMDPPQENEEEDWRYQSTRSRLKSDRTLSLSDSVYRLGGNRNSTTSNIHSHSMSRRSVLLAKPRSTRSSRASSKLTHDPFDDDDGDVYVEEEEEDDDDQDGDSDDDDGGDDDDNGTSNESEGIIEEIPSRPLPGAKYRQRIRSLPSTVASSGDSHSSWQDLVAEEIARARIDMHTTVTRLQDDLHRREAEAAHMQLALEAAHSDAKESLEKVSHVQNQLTQLSRQADESLRSAEISQKMCEEAQLQLRETESKLRHVQKQLVDAEHERNKIEIELQKKQIEWDKEKQAVILKLDHDLSLEMKKRESAEQEYKNASDNISRVEAEVQNLRLELSEAVDRQRSFASREAEHLRRIRELEEREAQFDHSLRLSVSEHQRSLREREIELSSMYDRQRRDLVEQIRVLEDQMRKETLKHEQRVLEVQERVRTETSKLQHLVTRLKQREEEVESKNSEVARLQRQSSALERELRTSKRQLESAQAEIEQAQEEARVARLDGEQSRNRYEWMEQESSRRVQQAEERVADLARQLESTGRELESCTRESSDRIHRLQVESEERYSSLTKHFETRIEELSQSERNAVGRAQRAERRCNALEEQIKIAEQAIESFAEEKQLVLNENEKLKGSLSNVEQDIDKLKLSIAQVETEKQNGKYECEKLQSVIDDLQRACAIESNRLETEHTNLVAASAEIDSLRKELQSVQNDLNRERRAAAENRREIDSLRRRCQRAEEQSCEAASLLESVLAQRNRSSSASFLKSSLLLREMLPSTEKLDDSVRDQHDIDTEHLSESGSLSETSSSVGVKSIDGLELKRVASSFLSSFHAATTVTSSNTSSALSREPTPSKISLPKHSPIDAKKSPANRRLAFDSGD